MGQGGGTGGFSSGVNEDFNFFAAKDGGHNKEVDVNIYIQVRLTYVGCSFVECFKSEFSSCRCVVIAYGL